MDDLKINRLLRGDRDLRLLQRSYILEPIVIRSQLKCTRAIRNANRQRRILGDEADADLVDYHHDSSFERLANGIARAQFRPKNGDLPRRTFSNAGRLVLVRGGSAIRRLRGFAGLGGQSAIRAKAQKKAQSEKEPIWKSVAYSNKLFQHTEKLLCRSRRTTLLLL